MRGENGIISVPSSSDHSRRHHHYFHMRQPLLSTLSNITSKKSNNQDHQSQKTLTTLLSTQQDTRPRHPTILRSSCSLPLGDDFRYTSYCGIQECDVSTAIVERHGLEKQGRNLPQYRASEFMLKNSNQLSAEDTRRLNNLLDITTATVKDPGVFCYLLQGEIRILLDPVSRSMDGPTTQAVRWKSDALSLGSASTATSLNTSLNTSLIGEDVEQASSQDKIFKAFSERPFLNGDVQDAHIHTSCGHQPEPITAHWKQILDKPTESVIPPDTRQSVVTWMSKVIEAMGWPLNSFFTAVHAMDYSLKHPSSPSAPVQESSVPLLSTACVLVGVSAECEHRQLQKARAFVGQVPHVESVKDIVCKQLAVVAGLDRGTLLHKTPLDFILYYLSAWRLHAQEIEDNRLASVDCKLWDKLFRLCLYREPCGSSLLQYVLQQSAHDNKTVAYRTPPSYVTLVELLIEGALTISIQCYLESIHTYVPVSRIVAAVMFSTLTVVEDSFRDVDFCAGFCRLVFNLDYLTELLPVLTDAMPPLYAVVTRRLRRATSFRDGNNPEPTCSESRFTSWSMAAQILKGFLDQVVANGHAAFPTN
eukprot:Blabericola_migrator_1__65@NODE_1015_length_5700_cov_454_708148_g697_i0_p2_GENE_NODE_1015_length_5700_cov_454_708148_g697_i0NODE_1015_length_5700_cov_454_708148_g697_i0_p2_ORF_typecomplete_len590_score91_78Cyclin_N/PF00134_23/0_00039_NODE_1015_length_5700_cov_454_708148_g697_i06472416